MLGYKNLHQFLRAYSVILLAVTIGFFVRLAKYEQFGFDAHIKITIVSVFLVIFFWESLRLVNFWLNKVYPFERNLTSRIILQLIIGIAVGITIRAMVYMWGEPHAPFKIDNLFLATTWVIYALVPVGVNLGFFTNYFIARWKDSLIRAERLEKEKSQVQFDNLKNQLNPHFLFNALTSLNSLIFENQQLASDFLQQLAKVYRYVLQNKNKNFVLLSVELDFISHYVRLLETRFHGALRIDFTIDEHSKEKAIVPVTLQILIENAIKHNIVDKNRPLHIDIKTTDGYLIVRNNLQLKKAVESSNKQGLDNLRSLYKFLSDKPIIVESDGESFSVQVPIIRQSTV